MTPKSVETLEGWVQFVCFVMLAALVVVPTLLPPREIAGFVLTGIVLLQRVKDVRYRDVRWGLAVRRFH